MKHSQSTKRTDDYIDNNQNASNGQVGSGAVNRKGQTLKEYQKAHIKQTSSGKERVRTIFEKRLDYLQELRAAFADGGADTTQDYFDALLLKLKTMESLDSDHVVSLLEDKDLDGTPALHLLLKDGCTDAVNECFAILPKFNSLRPLTPEQILKIVEAKNKDHETGLFVALQTGMLIL